MPLTSSDPNYQKQIKKLQEISKEIESIHRMKNPAYIDERIKRIESQISSLAEKIEKIAKIQSQSILQIIDIMQDSTNEKSEKIKETIKEKIEKTFSETDFLLLKSDFDLYKPDLRHLHEMNSYHASEVTED